MTALTTPTEPRRFPPGKLLLLTGVGAISGACVGYFAVTGLEYLHVSPRDIGWTDAIALWIGIVFIGYAAVFAYLSTNRRQLANVLEGEHAVVLATTAEVAATRLQTVVLGLAGLLLIAPISVQKILPIHSGLGEELYTAIVILLAVQTWANWKLWRTSDEYTRRLSAATAALTFAIGQGALFLWAAAEHLHLVRSLPAWNIYSLLMLLYLLASVGIALRRNRC